MAIQVRRGLIQDLDPTKLLPGEWACTIDSDTKKQTVWMCFKPGVVKQMGTLQDFKEQIADVTEDIRQEYIAEFNVILEQIQDLAQQTSTDTAIVVESKDEIINTYLPQMLAYVQDSENNASIATGKAIEAMEKAKEAGTSSIISKSYAIGGTGTRTDEDTDNAKYYKEQAALLVSSVSNALRPMGTISFSDLPAVGNTSGDMYNISDDFTSDTRFKDGGSKSYTAGSNIYYTEDGFWDVLQGDLAKYLLKTGDTSSNVVTFSEPEGLTNINTGETHSRIFGKLRKAISILVDLFNFVGDTNISKIGNGTVTSAVSVLNSEISVLDDNIMTIDAKVARKATRLKATGTKIELLNASAEVLSTVTTQDTNTWRPVENVLTSSSATNGLSASMGKYLNENKMNNMQTVSRAYMDGKDVPTGFYRIHNTETNTAQVWISLNYDTNFSVQMEFDYGNNTLFMRQCLYGTWTEWRAL